MRSASWLIALSAACAHAGADEVPFVVSPDTVTTAMLQLAKVGNEDYVIDLGSGDGRIVILAAKRGATGLGVDIDPKLVARARENAKLAGVAERARFEVKDLFETDLRGVNIVTMYLLPEVNLQLRPKLLQLRPGTRVVSHDFDMGDWEPEKTVVVDAPDKPIGLEKKSRVHLWVVPARVEGLWCGTGKAKARSINIAQRYQNVRIDIPEGDAVRALDGKVGGAVIRTRAGALNLVLDGGRLRATYASGATASLKGATFTRPKGQNCG